MNHIKLVTSSIVLFMVVNVLSALPTSDNARTANDLYENLLQREYTGPIPLSDHQVERKAVRSPSLRLRFGRRSDPDITPLGEKRFIQEVNQKPIRSPSLRLRFGRRSDPMVPVRPDEIDYDLYDDDLNSLKYESNNNKHGKGLYFGRNSYPKPNDQIFDNEWYTSNFNDKRAPAPRLRWGRNSFPKPNEQIFDNEWSTSNFNDKRAPAPRLRWGRSSNNNNYLFHHINQQLTDAQLEALKDIDSEEMKQHQSMLVDGSSHHDGAAATIDETGTN